MTLKSVNPGILTCPVCFRADEVSYPTPAPDGGWELECSAAHDGDGPYAFVVEPVLGRAGGRMHSVPTGITDDLLQPLQACFRAEDGWLEYGVIEYRLRQLAPEVFARHVREAGHRMFGPKTNTASCRISMALRRLRSQGHLDSYISGSTGAAWDGNPISYWSRTPDAARARALTWTQFCRVSGRTDDWDDTDRRGLDSPSQAPAPAR